MGEIYNVLERLIIYLFFILASIIISYVIIRSSIDLKNNPCFISLVCILYLAAFIYLNYISIFDLFFNNKDGFKKIREFITMYYLIFDWIDKILGYLIFSSWIGYLESGYYHIPKKLFDWIYRYLISIHKMKKKEKIIALILIIVIGGSLLAILIIYRDKYKLGNNPFNYLSILLNCYAVFEIYTNVGFYIVQFCSDSNRFKKKKKLKNITDIQKY